MKKPNWKSLRGIISIVCVVIILLIAYQTSGIERKTWVLYAALQSDPFVCIVAHGIEQDASAKDDPLYQRSKPIELICEARRGKLVLTDKTNGKTYEGTYKVTSLGHNRRLGSDKGANYRIEINGVEGRANISAQGIPMLSIVIDGYTLEFASA